MSVVYCESCDRTIDTDFEAEHFDEGGNCEFQDIREVLNEFSEVSA